MRSQLVFDATTHTSNRYRLTMLVARATRKLHRPGARVPSSVNEALERLAGAEMAPGGKAPSTPPDPLPSSDKDLERSAGWVPPWDHPAAVSGSV
jgi:hypothetical protein